MKRNNLSKWELFCLEHDIRDWDNNLYDKKNARINLYETLSLGNAIEVAITSTDWNHFIQSHRWHYPYFHHYSAIGLNRETLERRRMQILKKAWDMTALGDYLIKYNCLKK